MAESASARQVEVRLTSASSIRSQGGSRISPLGDLAISGSALETRLEAEDESSIVWVPTNALRYADSPRLAGENEEHIMVLASSQARLPAILVRRATMCVIDGMHRLRAAILRGQDYVEVRFFDGDTDAAFVLAVRSNIAHGLPLTLADRTQAASRIIKSHPHWSDRMIAASAGLSPKTVGTIRRRSNTETHPTVRLGRDGRARVVKRQTRNAIFADVAVEALARGAPDAEAPLTFPRPRPPLESTAPRVSRPARTESQKVEDLSTGSRRTARASTDTASILSALRRDPSLRFTESGRKLLRLLDSHNVSPHPWEQMMEAVPAHCVDRVAEVARRYSSAWREFADLLGQQTPRA
jgi:ParB-like nuclease family protein